MKVEIMSSPKHVSIVGTIKYMSFRAHSRIIHVPSLPFP